VRAVRAYCAATGTAQPSVFHSNEGHAGFLGVERIRELVENEGLTFDEALRAVRAGTVFTTHTPVPAGIDRFDRGLIAAHLTGMGALPAERILALGAEDDPNIFNMAHMGLRLGQRANGVSLLHGEVSREMFAELWPGFDIDEVPITSVTNGVHAPTWMARDIIEIAEREVGSVALQTGGWEAIDKVADGELWGVRNTLRARLVNEIRRRVHESALVRGMAPAELGWTSRAFDPNVLTIGFARRVPSYKRLTLMLRDAERLRALLLDPERPVQIVIAGKSHPADDGGKQLIAQMVRFADDPAVRHRITFLPDYDIGMARFLYWGVDVWLNNPLRPLEACGTSGMKAALNGALNLSILDGWWDEWFDGKNGWAIPTADGVEDPERRDDIEANALYDLVENQVAPRFYDVDEDDLPQNWLAMMLHTVTTLGPKVRASRMVRDYTQKLYVPAARSGWALKEGDYAGARDLATYKAKARAAWSHVHVDHVESSGVGDSPEIGETLHVTAYVSLGDLTPDDVEVQVAHGRTNHHGDELHDVSSVPLAHVESYEHGRHQFSGDLLLRSSGAFGYTVRVLPKHPGLAHPSSLGLVANA
jgi:starch phosphorylase